MTAHVQSQLLTPIYNGLFAWFTVLGAVRVCHGEFHVGLKSGSMLLMAVQLEWLCSWGVDHHDTELHLPFAPPLPFSMLTKCHVVCRAAELSPGTHLPMQSKMIPRSMWEGSCLRLSVCTKRREYVMSRRRSPSEDVEGSYLREVCRKQTYHVSVKCLAQ